MAGTEAFEARAGRAGQRCNAASLAESGLSSAPTSSAMAPLCRRQCAWTRPCCGGGAVRRLTLSVFRMLLWMPPSHVNRVVTKHGHG